MKFKVKSLSNAIAFSLSTASPVLMASTTEPAQYVGTDANWQTTPVFTIGESFSGYTPPGIPDGMGAFEQADSVVILANHELTANSGYSFTLANGTELTGSRISAMEFDKSTRTLINMGPAFDTIINRAGQEVAASTDLDFGGINRLCSAGSVKAGTSGFVDDIFFSGEETNGGSEFVLDVSNQTLWAVPWMGRAAWESVAILNIPAINKTHIAITIGDDRGDAPLLLYVGEKQPGGNFLARNGLVGGQLYMWVENNGDLSPAQWNGTGSTRSGKFVEVENYNLAQAGQLNFDALGFATQDYLDGQKATIGAFNFSRPEDLHVNPNNGNQFVFASTGRNTAINQGADLWGTTYLVDVKINLGRIKNDNITADIKIIYDGDDADKQDSGIRSPDNLVWADNGLIYLQEDRSIGAFGSVSGEEASIWELNPETSQVTRIAQADRSAVPTNQVDIDPNDLGDWESSGIIDVTSEFNTNEPLFFFNVQAHSVRGGEIESVNLVQGGQFLFLENLPN